MVEEKLLDNIITNTVKAIEDSKSQIYEIYENSRDETMRMSEHLTMLKTDVQKILLLTARLEKQERAARQHLSEVSSDFSRHGEEDIKRSYDYAQRLQIELAIMREKEQNLMRQRNDLEIRLRQMEKTVEKAGALISKVGVVLGYMSTQMGTVAAWLEEAKEDKFSAEMMIKAQEDERLRISQEIHDGPAQLIANILYRSNVCEAKLDFDIDAAKNDLKVIKSQIKGCLSEIRQIVFDLRPMTLDDLGLVAAVYHFIQRYEERTGMRIDFNVRGEEVPTAKYSEVGLFRIIQEALNNAHKHSGVNNAEVLLRYGNGRIDILIRDEGRGFDALAQRERIKNGENASYGLLGIFERVKILHGKINIDSKIGKGTKIWVSIPLEER